MFYEIKDKRVETGGTQTRWWLTAAFSGVVVTAGCVGIIFWLVMAVRQPETAYERRPSSSFRDYHHQHHHKINTKSSSSPSPPPPLDYPTAEILKTTVKRKQGRVEMVKNSDDKLEPDANDGYASDSGGEKKSKNSAPLPLPTTIESNDDDYAEATAAENDSPDVQLRSKIAKLSSIRGYDDDDDHHHHHHDVAGNKHNRGGAHLKGGISPMEEQTSLPLPAAADDSDGVDGDVRGNSVKKKSEAVLPSWYDPNLQNANPSKPDPVNDLKQDGAYDLPDFSVIKPDLAAFNTKTIPAFTYLKEPLPRFEHMAAAAAAAASGSPDVDDSLYYHHHHHHHHLHNGNNHHHPHQVRQQDDPGADNNRIEQDQLIQEPFSALNSLANEDFIKAAGAAAAAVMTNTVGASAGANNYSLMNFLQSRLQNMHDWLLYGSKRNRTGSGHGGGGGGGGVDIMEIVKMVNNSLQAKTVGTIFSKLKDLYAGFNSSDVQNMPVANLLYPTSPSLLSNSTSLVSFGLLAIDLFLLHNVQQIVWNEESQIGEEMLKDPDVVALNALFMSPDRVQQLKQTNSRIFTADTTDREKKSVVHDLLEFINGGLRAVLNLSKAYKSSVSRANARSTSNGSGTASGSTLDCIWTLYCRNLDKTAKLQGPYGFLAKMNSLGLRLMMGEFPVDKALDRLMKEYNSGWGSLDCDKLFPRCNAEEAKEIVIQTALGRSTF